jgi:hypothetical protein
LHAANQDVQAQAAWQEALTIYEVLQLPEGAELRARLATLPGEGQAPSG